MRLSTLPLDSPLADSISGDEEAVKEAAEPSVDENGRIPAPKALYNIPVAKSFAEVGSFVRGQDLN